MAAQQNKQEVKKETVKKTENEFFLHDLRKHSQELFGVKPEVLDGAFLNVTEKKLTKSKAKGLIQGFLKKEVK